MKRGLWALAVGTALAAFGSATMAGVTYDTTLASPGLGSPGWYNGTGNPQGGFTVDNENSIEVGLRAKLRDSINVIDTPNNVYVVPPGAEIGVPNRAAWNYEFSIDLKGALDGNGNQLTLDEISDNTRLTITDITPSTPVSATVNPLKYWNDDAGFSSSGKDTYTPGSSSDFGAQNSENPIFGDFPLHSTYNEFAADTYEITLTVIDNSGKLLGSDTIDVVVAPLPSSLLAGLALLGGLGIVVAAKRLRRTAAI